MKRFAVIFSLYTLFGVITLWALISQITTVVPGGPGTDYQHFIWNYWWLEHALKAGISPWFTDYVLYPNVHNLSIHTTTPIWFPLWLIIEPFIGRVAWINLIVLMCFPLNATAMFYWLRGYCRDVVAFIGGTIFAFHPYIVWSAADTHINVIALWWLPLTAILWRSITQVPRWWKSIMMGLVLWACILTDFQYALFLPFTLGIYGIWSVFESRQRLRLLIHGAVAVVILGGVMLVIYPLPQLASLETSNPYVFPPASLDSIRDWAFPLEALVGLSDAPKRTLGVILPILLWGSVLLYTWQRKIDQRLVWFIAAIPAIWLMLGAQNDRMPYWYLHEALNGQYRTPERFIIPAIFCMITFAASVYKLRQWWIAGLISLVVLIDFGTLKPFPVQHIRDYPIYHTIGAEDADYVIMDLPVGVHYGWTGMGDGRYSQFYAPVHQKRVINGFLARMRFPDYAYYTDSELFTWLAYPANDERQTDIVDEFNRIVNDYPIGYVFAHRYWMSTDQQNLLIGWMNMRDGFCPPQMADDTELIWWRHERLECPPASSVETIDIGHPTDWLFIGTGWSWQEDIGGVSARWAGETAALRVDLSPDHQYEVTLSALAFDHPRALTIGNQTIIVESQGWQNYTVTIPGVKWLILQHESADSPVELGLSGDTRALSIAYDYIILRQVGD
ncbi:MAG: hypothetical protein D6711_05145 [Chloroflexi bacterium]|nr:MAG: hypothetical protein D6711_05145 [Chloroflexota bacterium]